MIFILRLLFWLLLSTLRNFSETVISLKRDRILINGKKIFFKLLVAFTTIQHPYLQKLNPQLKALYSIEKGTVRLIKAQILVLID